MSTVINQFYRLTDELRETRAAIAENERTQAELTQTLRQEELTLCAGLTQELAQMQSDEQKISRYCEEALKFITPDLRYVPSSGTPYKMSELYRHYATLSGPFHKSPSCAKFAAQLWEGCQDARSYIAHRRKEIESEMAQIRRTVLSRPEYLQSRLRNKQLQAVISDRILPQMRKVKSLSQPMDSGFQVDPTLEYSPKIPQSAPKEMLFGMVEFPNSGEDHRPFRIPFGFLGEDPDAAGMYDARSIRVRYNAETQSRIPKIVRGICFNILRNYPPLCGRITYADFGTFNSEFLECMRPFTSEDSLIIFPRNSNEAITALSRLEADAAAEPENARHRRYLIIRDGTGSITQGKFTELLQNIANNAAKNNVVIIHLNHEKESSTPAYTRAHTTIYARGGQFRMSMPDEDRPFHWFDAPRALTERSVSAFQEKLVPRKVSNEYENFFPLSTPVEYKRDRRPITLPYGMDEKGNILSLTFEGMNFASFVMGASGSGKSTFLHTLIAGIIKNYHPDEIELWLADLKMMEFANYTHHMPPHIKYILMDSSKEMVHDFIDLLYEELERRQVLLATCGTNNCKDLPREKYLPILFVIIDEFSTLSDIIRDDDTYKRKLEQVLVRGRGAGFRLIFASQSFTDGAPALTTLAKRQIQTRIAMKNTPEEIKQTLELTGDETTDALRHQINTLPPHYMLRRVQEKSGTHRVDKAHCLYFNGKDDEGWRSRFALIDRLNQMQPVTLSRFDPDRIDQYVEKKPIVVSSKSLQAFNDRQFGREVSRFKRDPDNIVFDEDILVRFGQPRKLADNLMTVMTNEAFENILLMAGNKELTCGMSVILSAIRSFRHQGAEIQVWAHPRSRMYHWYKDTSLAEYPVCLGLEEIRQSIDNLRTWIQKRRSGNKLIVLLGMEGICPDLTESSADGFSIAPAVELEQIAAAPAGEEMPAMDTTQLEENCLQSLDDLLDMYDQFYEEQSALGKTDEEIDEEFDKIRLKYMKETHNIDAAPAQKPEKKAPDAASYRRVDYLSDFQQLLRVGSRWGYHFLVYVPNYTALQAMGTNVRMFNHRLSFKTDSTDTSMTLFNNGSAFRLPEHTCYYCAFGSSEGSYAVTPYLHRGVTWNNWTVDDNGIARDLSRL